MSNLTIAIDDSVIKQARIRAIQEGTSVSAKLREYLAIYAAGDAGPPIARDASPGFRALAPAEAPPSPDWLQALRARVEEFGGIEPEEWLEPRDPRGARDVDFEA